MASQTSCVLRWALLAAIPVLACANFDTDVVRPVRRTAMANRQLPFLKREMDVDPLSHPDLNAALLAKAVPLAEYEKQVAQRGGNHRVLNQDQKYDFDVDYDSMYSFSGFSLKYAKCQPVQYFSEDAILAGEHSPMVTEDIVILRLCPQATCSSSSSYGCYYNFADYALTLGEYIGIMLRYSARVRDNTCEWCDQCLKNERGRGRRRRLEDGQAAAEGEDAAAAEEGDAAAEGENADAEAQADADAAAADDAAAAAADDAVTDDFDPSEYACDGYNDYCTNYQAMCGDGDDDTYIDYESFIDYMDCAEVKYNDYAYFVRPKCDSDSGTIKMAVYYDNYCIQYAGNDINVKNLGLGFKEGMFSEFYSSTCIECSDSVRWVSCCRPLRHLRCAH